MKKHITLTILALSFVLGAVQFTFAQDQPIDSFTTGYLKPVLVKSGSNQSILSGNMMGGTRQTTMFVCDTKKKGDCASRNPYGQSSSYGFLPENAGQPAAMIQTGGYLAPPRIDMGYGYQNPMNWDFSGYQKIRVNFTGLSQTLNFNILLYSGAPYAIGGCNIPAYAGTFSVELPLNLFQQGKDFTLTDVTNIDVIFQDGSVIGNVGFGITSIELSNTSAGGVVVDCHY
jgi:hypothetical protein